MNGDNPEDLTLDSSTGANDSSSIWGAGLLDRIPELATSAATIYGAINRPGSPAAVQAASPVAGAQSAPPPASGISPKATSALPSWLPWALGIGAVVLAVVVFWRK